MAKGPSADALVHLGRGEGDTFIEILDVVVHGDTVFSCTGTQGLTVWDAADPEKPKLLVEGIGPDKISHPRFPRCQRVALDAKAEHAVMTNRGDEIQPVPFVAMYDVKDPKSPKISATWQGSASIESATFAGARVVAAAHTKGLVVFERKGTTLRQVGSFADGSSDAWHVLHHGSKLVAAEGNTGLRIYELRGAAPKLLSTLDLPGSAKDVALSDDAKTAYLPTSDGLAVVDISKPEAPRLLSHTETPGTALAVSTGRAGFVFVADWGELRGYDVRDPKAPRLAVSQSVPTKGDFSRVLALEAREDGRVFAGEWRGMHAFDHDPAAHGPDIALEGTPVLYGRVETGAQARAQVWVHNTGDAPLVVRDVVSHTALTVTPPCFSLEPEASTHVDVSWTPSYPGPLSGDLAFLSNDPDEGELLAKITGNLEGVGVGEPAPDFSAVDLEGKVWNNERLRGNVVLLAYFATF